MDEYSKKLRMEKRSELVLILNHQIKMIKREELAHKVEELGLGNFFKKAKRVIEHITPGDQKQEKQEKDKKNQIQTQKDVDALHHPRGPGHSLFKEKDHPRDPDGKFTKNEGGSKSTNGIIRTVSNSEEGITEIKSDKPCSKIDGVNVCGSVYRTKAEDGTVLSIYDKGGNSAPPERKKVMLESLVRLHNLYPEIKVTKILLTDDATIIKEMGKKFVAADGNPSDAWVSIKDKATINVRSATLASKTISGISFSPSNAAIDRLITHEFGHQYDYAHNPKRNATKALFKNPNIKKALTKYGKTTQDEAYAECFADWHQSKGDPRGNTQFSSTTEYAATLAYARHEGWIGAKQGTHFVVSTLEFATDKIDTEEYIIVDTFDEKNGPIIIGTSPRTDPTPEDEKRADDIVREVFKELGLDYK